MKLATGKCLVAQAPLWGPLGFRDARLNPATSLDAALAKANGHEARIEVLDRTSCGPAQPTTWEGLARASEGLPGLAGSSAVTELAWGLSRLVSEFQLDTVVMEVGDWTVPAKDLADASVCLALARQLRRLGVYTVGVGPLVTAAPDYFLQAFDVVVCGVPGETLLKVLDERPAGTFQGSGVAVYLPLLPEIANGGPSLDTSRVASAFGCPYAKCKFCPSAIQFQRRVWSRENDIVVADVNRRKEHRIHFVDNYFGHERTRLQALAPRLAELGREFVVDVRVEAADDPETLSLLRRMNVVQVKVGVESLDDAVLSATGKGQTVEGTVAALRRFDEAGFEVFCYLLFGPWDNPATIERTLHRAEELASVKVWLPNFFCAPGDTHPRAHHFSVPQARRLGIPEELIARIIRLSGTRHPSGTVSSRAA